MGALEDGHPELDGGVSSGFNELAAMVEVSDVAIEDAVKVLLSGLGEDVNREGLRKTPFRVAKAFKEGTRGYSQKVKDVIKGTLFHATGFNNGSDLVIIHDLDLFSYCESCLLPFQVKCHVGYIPSDEHVLGLSKISRVADVFAKRLQEPQRLADEVCLALHSGIKPGGVAVILQCSHVHFPFSQSDPPDLNWIKLSVSSGSGTFQDRKAVEWNDFLNLLKLKGVMVEKTWFLESSRRSWCSRRCSISIDPRMTIAAGSIIRSLGEDSLRKELIGTSNRFVSWLMLFKDCKSEMSLSNGMVHNEEESGNQIYCELSLPFCSLCEHHLLPFYGVVHIGYVHRPVGRSLLQSIVQFRGSKIHLQERFTSEIAETVSSLLGDDVMVMVEGSHMCMISGGVEKLGSSTTTVAALGCFSTDFSARESFLDMIPRS